MAGSPAYNARNARARALGYQSYYDYRAHGNGKLPPSAPRLAGTALARARGHLGGADLVRSARPGDFVTATPDPTSRQKDGTYKRIYITLIGDDGKEREFLIRVGKPGDLEKVIAGLGAAGVTFSPSPSLDINDFAGSATEDDEEPDEDYSDQDYDDIPF